MVDDSNSGVDLTGGSYLYEVFQAGAEWRWRLRRLEGEIMETSFGAFRCKEDAQAAAEAAFTSRIG